jgi:heme exporter protein C
MGPVQKIFYVHLPVATITFAACFAVFAASAAYLWQRSSVWDDLAHAGAEVSVLFSSMVLVTGMVWAREAWGHWWTWSPRLTFSLVLWLLYLVYLVMRPSIESAQRRAVVCAVYGVVAFLDVPLVYFSTRMMEDIHPASIELTPEMRHTALFWFLPVAMLCVGLIWARFGLLRRERELGEPGAAAALGGQA